MKLTAKVETLLSIKKRCFRRLLREMRKKVGWTQREFAKRLRQPQSFVSKYERGKRRLDYFELEEICELLGWTFVRFTTQLKKVVQAEQKMAAGTAPKSFGEPRSRNKPPQRAQTFRW